MFPLIILAILAVTGFGNVDYTMTDGNALNATIDHSTNSLLIDINSTSGGGLFAIEIPKTLLDTNSTFFILNDGNMTMYKEQDTSSTRAIIIPYMQNDERIVITGTHSAPEFPMAYIILPAIFSGIILLGRLVDGHWAWDFPKVRKP